MSLNSFFKLFFLNIFISPICPYTSREYHEYSIILTNIVFYLNFISLICPRFIDAPTPVTDYLKPAIYTSLYS